jgi:hypothetical protein
MRHQEVCTDFQSDLKELGLKHNAHRFIKRVELDIELCDVKDRLKFKDLKRAFLNVDEPKDLR